MVVRNNLPVIGITARQKFRGPEDGLTVLGNKIQFSVAGHPWAVEKARGLPIIIPLLQEDGWETSYLDLIDGVIITEGEDLTPSTYQQEVLPECSKNLDPVKDAFELKLLEKALSLDMPVLGICRGIHVLNVLMGGTLVQDLPTYFKPENGKSVRHRADGDERYRNFHDVTLKEDSHVAKCYGAARINVNSIHHQGVGRLGNGLIATAWSEDGLVEAVEMADRSFVLALQWHPERIWTDTPIHLKVFDRFVKAALEYKIKKL